MRQMPDEEFSHLIELAHESRNIEFKTSFSWSDDGSRWLREHVIRAILGIANTPDGGYIIIGIDEENGNPVFNGADNHHIETFTFDAITGKISGFASSTINIEIYVAEANDKKFIVLQIDEFDIHPIICRNNGQEPGILEKGRIYCRANSGPPRTIPVTEVEMQEIIELAVDKQQVTLRQRGYTYSGTDSTEPNLFAQQQQDFELSDEENN